MIRSITDWLRPAIYTSGKPVAAQIKDSGGSLGGLLNNLVVSGGFLAVSGSLWGSPVENSAKHVPTNSDKHNTNTASLRLELYNITHICQTAILCSTEDASLQAKRGYLQPKLGSGKG